MAVLINFGSGFLIGRDIKGPFPVMGFSFWSVVDYQDGSLIYVNPGKVVFYKQISDDLADRIVDQAKMDRRIYVPREN